MKAIAIKINNRVNPLGIDDPTPHISWICDSGKKQVAYRVIFSDDSGETVYDTGERFSDDMCCDYSGRPLATGERISIKIILEDDTGARETSDEDVWFEMGLLNPNDWEASFICGVDTDKSERLPLDYYKKEFDTPTDKKIKRARLYASALGVYSAYLNGNKLNGVLTPGFTDYNKRLYYQVYDVTNDLLNGSANEISFVVGDGWYKGRIGHGEREYFYGTRTALLSQLNITYDDDTTDVIASDENFKWCNNGPLRYSDIAGGEICDARMIPTYHTNAVKADNPVWPEANVGNGIAVHDIRRGSIIDSYAGRWTIDFGHIVTGLLSLKYMGTFGEEVRIFLSEDLENIGDKPDITYICSGTDESYESLFFLRPFRYAVIDGVRDLDDDAVSLAEAYADVQFVGDFSCGDAQIDALVTEAKDLIKNSFFDSPASIPAVSGTTRTCDAMLFARASMYIADFGGLYDKWLYDVRDAQDENGSIALAVPKLNADGAEELLNGRIGWADAAIRIPYLLYRIYNNKRYIENHLPLILEWKRFIAEAAGQKDIYNLSGKDPMKERIGSFLLPDAPYNHYIVESGMQWGEWDDPEGEQSLVKGALPRRARQEVNAAYTAYSMRLAAQMMEVCGQDDDADECWEISLGARGGYRHHFINEERHHKETMRQAPLVRALAFGLTSLGAEEHIIARDLNAMVENADYTITTGYLSTPDILGVLCRYGYEDTAYRVIRSGAISDRVSGAAENVVRASMSTFCFDTMLGISVNTTGSFTIAPVPGKGIPHAKGYWDSPRGRVSVEWNKRADGADGYEFYITIPPNNSASIELPDGQMYFVTSGEYRYLTDNVKFYVE